MRDLFIQIPYLCDMRIIKFIIVIVVSSYLIYMGINFMISFKNLSPKINKVFLDLENLENNQELTDSVIRLKGINNQLVLVDFNQNDTLTLSFVDCKDEFLYCNREIKSKIQKNSYVILNNEDCNFKKDLICSIYILEGNLPLKYNKLVYPYTIKVSKGKVLSSKFNFLDDE